MNVVNGKRISTSTLDYKRFPLLLSFLFELSYSIALFLWILVYLLCFLVYDLKFMVITLGTNRVFLCGCFASTRIVGFTEEEIPLSRTFSLSFYPF